MKNIIYILFLPFILSCCTLTSKKEGKAVEIKIIETPLRSFTYQNLLPIMKELNKRLENKPDSIGFCYAALMENENCIEIGLSDTTLQHIEAFKKAVMDSPAFKFVKSEPVHFE